ncbi:hypothetical protein GCM10020370_43970 [Paenibacillus hodogayensis]
MNYTRATKLRELLYHTDWPISITKTLIRQGLRVYLQKRIDRGKPCGFVVGKMGY